jgi:hypothetical protein
MQAIAPEGLETSLTSNGSAVSEIVESFIESTAKLAESLDAPEERVSDFQESGKKLAHLVEGIAQDSAQARESAHEAEANVDELESELQDNTARMDALGDGISNANDEIEALKTSEQETTPTPAPAPEAGQTTLQKPQTPLEQTCSLPQEMIDDESANVRRAVFIASDVTDYTKKVPAGRVIRSSELRRVLKAGTDCRGHSQTVDRVMSVLDDLGGDDVQVVNRRGERRVVFTEQLVTRLEQLTEVESTSHNVVTPNEV